MQNHVPALVAIAALTFPAHQEEGPTEEQVEVTVQLLKEAFSEGESADRIAALQSAADVPDKRVVKSVTKGLSDKEAPVQMAAIECLRFMEHPEALEALHSCYRRDRKLVKDPERSPALFRAIGHHASPSSLDVLTDDPFSTTEDVILQARILAIANIRSRDSVDELIDLMNRAGRRRLYPNMDTFRLALTRLTGVDKGKTLDSWQRWWNDVKRDLVVSPEPPKMSKVDQYKWERFWGLERTRERTVRRGDRGNG